ncbi:hypothetical protein D9619_005113 [Psilocybe cf. subviscida]|uniref:Nephrocystin 3-like N-terminal domain-containing protein n=1 Tax=Psilocybe cf. subviscida TaxID=2480587 RepID=A0A8H5F891_9AGAR|nr:hypothetical protein D9619_005113 [Psilocybe cf. subviscida]
MSFFPNAHNTIISGQNVTMTAYSGSHAADRGFDILCQNTTPAALYGSSTSAKNPGCLPGTRLNVQGHIFKWLDNPEGEVAMWMYGPAGIGKTAITQTVAKICADTGKLSSTFFFFRSDEGCNSAKHLVPTLAYGMLRHMPHTRGVVCAPIGSDPLIFSAPLERQIRTIIFPALAEPFPPSHGTPPGPMLFIIDGLDECMDTGIQELIIRLFVSLLTATATSIRHRILIVSRPESHIVSTFSAVDIARHVNHLCLDKWKSNADIETYLRAKLEAVKQTHPSRSYLHAWWPSDSSFRKLLHKSSESFAYASLAVRYISSHDRHPETSLANLLGLNSDCAYEAHAELDLLYRHILESLDQKTRFTVQKILCLHMYLAIDDVDTLGSLLGEEAFVVELAITKMTSVVRFEKSAGTISYYHTSFSDFLVDKTRSGALYLYSPDVASTVEKALPRGWMQPTTREDYELLAAIAKNLSGNFKAGDMHIHIFRAFLATHLPTTIIVPRDYSSDSIIYTFSVFVRETDTAAHSEYYSQAVRLLSREALQHMSKWLWSQGRRARVLFDIILDAVFMPESTSESPLTLTTPSTDRPHLACDVIANIVGCSGNPWRRLHQLLPREEILEISVGFVKRYLAMPAEARSDDILEYSISVPDPGSLTHMLMCVLESAPARADICRMLEQIILEATSDSPRQITPQEFISFRLWQDMWGSTQLPIMREFRLTQTKQAIFSISKAMDQYIRKTHSELHHP